MSRSSSETAVFDWPTLRAALVGRFAALTKREARRQLAARKARLADELDSSVNLIVVGEQDLPPADLPERIAAAGLDPAALRIVTETELLRALGVVDAEHAVHRLYTPAMLADLVGVPVAVVRRWHRRGLITPQREVRKLPYFDYCEVQTARHLAAWLAAGVSPAVIERQLSALRRLLPAVDRPLAQLSVIIQGRDLLLRQGDGLIEPGGQYRFDFESLDAVSSDAQADAPSADADAAIAVSPLPDLSADLAPPRSAAALRDQAAALEEAGRLEEAADMVRAALAAEGPNAEACFQLADVLYRLGDRGGARERYFMAVELDEDYVEARANLGCLLAEEKRYDLAIAAFEGALRYHDDYPDVHYQLARALDEVGRRGEAETHWRAFLDLVPESPWAENARRRLNLPTTPAAGDE